MFKLGIYFGKQTILYDRLGKENVDKVENVGKEESEVLQEKTKKTTYVLLQQYALAYLQNLHWSVLQL